MQHPFVPQFESGTLLADIRSRTQQALACRALQPIETEVAFLDQGGVRFLVRVLANVDRKARAKQVQETQSQAQGKEINPFLPYDPDLFVTDITETHLCLLNKYNVVENHILIITRAFEEQDSWLTTADFQALAACMAELDGLAFYNGGTLAGASQRHKHLQLVPLPIAPDGSPLPLDPQVQRLPCQSPIDTLADLPFDHAVLRLQANWLTAADPGTYLLTCYRQGMAAIGLDLEALLPDRPYNLLVTRQWMMAVPRSQESYQSIPVNSLGFAGSLLVKNAEQMALLQEIGPMTLLSQVAFPR